MFIHLILIPHHLFFSQLGQRIVIDKSQQKKNAREGTKDRIAMVFTFDAIIKVLSNRKSAIWQIWIEVEWKGNFLKERQPVQGKQ